MNAFPVSSKIYSERTAVDILLVEDHPPILNFLSKALMESGYSVRTAVNGRKATVLLEQHIFRLLITDIYMPEMDGFEVIMLHRATNPDVPVLAMTGGCRHTPAEENLKMARILGSGATIAKPFELPAFLETVKSMLAQ
jgi:two-component system, chemotaxis family, chemotaxis protein CheY